MSMIFRLLVLWLMVLPAIADTANPLEPIDTSSPSATFQSFLTETRRIEDEYTDYLAHKTAAKAAAFLFSVDRMRRVLDLSSLPPATRDKQAGAAIAYLVDVLARLPEVPSAEIPGAPGRDWGKLPAKWTVPGTEIQIVRMESGPRAGEYLFSADTVERLPEFYALIINRPPMRPVAYPSWRQEQINLTGPLIPDRLIRSLPESLHRTVLDTPVWKVVLTLVIALAILVAVFLWALLARRAGRNASHTRRLFWRLTTPLAFAALIFLAHWFIRGQVNLSGDFNTGETIPATVALYVAVAWAAWVACFFVVETIIASPRVPDNSYDAHLLRLAARLGAVLAAGGIVVYGANEIGIPALGLVAGLGVGGFALALASQSTVENLFGGLSIFADRPFRVGDFIKYGDGSGAVEAIGPRSSRIRAADGTLAAVPNSDLAKMHVTNFSMRNKCLLLHTIGLRYETSPAQLEWLLEALRQLVADHPMVEKSSGSPRVALIGLGDSSINVEVRAYVLTADFNEFLRIQERLILDIMRTVGAAGTGFAFPSQTTYLTRDTGLDGSVRKRIEEEMQLRRLPGAANERR